jgi:hypothetical protein
MDQKMNLVHLHLQDVTDNFQDRRYRLDVEYLDALQNQDEQNQDAVLTFRDVHLENLVHRLDVVVDVELRHQLRMDYFPDVVDVELRVMFHQQLRMDYFQDVEQLAYFLQLALLHLGLKQKTVLVQEPLPQRFQRAMLLTPLNQRRVRRQVQRQVQG